jgi:hypothetical protein
MPGDKVGLEGVRVGVGERSANDLLHPTVVEIYAGSESTPATCGCHWKVSLPDIQWSRGERARLWRTRLALLVTLTLGLAIASIPTMWSRARTAWGAFGKQYPAGRRTVSSLVWLPTAVVFTQYFYSVKLVSGRSMQVRYTHMFMSGSLKVSQAAHAEPTLERMAGPGRVRPCLYLQ